MHVHVHMHDSYICTNIPAAIFGRGGKEKGRATTVVIELKSDILKLLEFACFQFLSILSSHCANLLQLSIVMAKK